MELRTLQRTVKWFQLKYQIQTKFPITVLLNVAKTSPFYKIHHFKHNEFREMRYDRAANKKP